MTIFDLTINLIEGILFSVFIIQSVNDNKRFPYIHMITFSLLFFTNITLYNYYNLGEIYCTFSIILISIILGYILIKSHLFQIVVIAMIIYFFSFLSNTLVIIINQIFFTNQSIPLYILIIISKIIFFSFAMIMPFYLKKIINSEYTKNWYFNIAFISLLGIYTLVFDSLFYEDQINFKLYFTIVCILILTIAIYKVFQYVIMINQKKAEAQLAIKELSLNQKNYNLIKYSLDALSDSQHDMIYTLNHIKKLNQHQNTSLDEFIDSQIKTIYQKIKPIVSGNSTLDYILYQYMPILKSQNIHLLYTKDPSTCPIPNIIYYTIMNYILDIAIQNCENHVHAQIYIQHGYIENQFFTKVTFPFEKSVDQKEILFIENHLKNYSHILISESDVNVYILGFMINQKKTI